MEIVFDSTVLPAGERLEAWTEVTAQALMRTRIKVTEPSSFEARLWATVLGAARLTVTSYGPLVARRTPALIRQLDPEWYQVAVVRSGRQGIEQARNRSRLEAGSLVVYDSSRPFEAVVDGIGPTETLLLQFPKRLVPLPSSKIDRLLAVPLPGTQGIGRVFTRFVNTLAEEPSAPYPALDRVRLGQTALDLAAAVLAHHLDEEAAAPSRSPGHVLFLRFTSFIEEHLRDPDLGPAAVAAAHQVSLRYLHRIFQEHGTSVSAHVKQRRLDRCRRDLADPALRHLTVHAIATRWGFTRASDFSRSFRAAVGMPPGRYRAAALAPAAEDDGESAPAGRVPGRGRSGGEPEPGPSP
ncbi:helix-turn-helix domain-containing protein [Streptomyces albus]|uniref:AraC-like ligand-binding domain-containing protein n=1 Tax=Streptomyces albus TaxID=1888 RepID=UPI000A9C1DAA|nr:helix-turn-helix domain-containing protein [Streptomyces albus]